MRGLRRNQRAVWFAHRLNDEPERDEDGNLTLDYTPTFSKPECLFCMVTGESGGWNGAETGEYKAKPFGLHGDFTRTAYYTGRTCPVQNGDLVWVDAEPENGIHHDYEVVRVTGLLGEWNIGMRQVTVS